MVYVLVVEFAPEANFSADDILFVGVVFDHSIEIDVVEIQPSLVVAIGYSQVVTHSHVQIERAVLGNYHLLFGSWHASSPPMHDVAVLDLDVVGVHPVHKLLIRVQIGQDLVLLTAVVTLDLLLFDPLFRDEFSLISQASQNHFISSQVDYWVGENIEHLGKDLLHQLVGFVEGDIQRTHESRSKSTGYTLIFGSEAPTSCVTRSIELRNDPNSSLHRILNQVPCLLGSISFFGRKGSILSDLWMGVEDQGKRILIDDMPVHDVHFVVHQCIDGLLEDLNGEEVARSVNHKSSIVQERLVLDAERDVADSALLVFVPGASHRLHEGLQSADKTHVGYCPQSGAAHRCHHFILLLLRSKDTFEGGVVYFYLDPVGEVGHIDVESGRNDDIGNSAVQGLPHLEGDKFFNVFVGAVFQLDMEEQLAWIVKGSVVVAAGDFTGHGDEVELFALVDCLGGAEEGCQEEECYELYQLHKQFEF